MSVFILDTETTDKEPGREVIEGAWIELSPDVGLLGSEPDRIPEKLEPLNIFSGRFKPTKPINLGAMALHHILDSELEGCPPSETFGIPAGAEYIIGHRIDFDWEAIGSPDVKRICTLAMAEHIWPEADSHSQSALLYLILGTNIHTRQMLKDAHSALADAQNNLVLLRAILAEKSNIKTWSALHAYSEECRIPLYCPLKRWSDLKLDEMDDGAINWCLRQGFIDEYFRKGLEMVMDRRYPRRRSVYEESDDDGIPY